MKYIPMWTPEDAFKAYRPLVENYDQAVPILTWASAQGITPVQVQPPEGEDLPLAVLYGGVVEEAVAELGRPQWVLSSCEAWTMPVENMAQVENYQHGDAGKLAQAGDTSVTEAVFIVCVGTTGEWTYCVPFTRTPHRVRWGTPQLTQSAEGGVADVLKRLVR